MAGLVERLERMIRQRVLERLPPDASGELERCDLPEALLTYGNWRYRHVSLRRRTVHISRALRRSPKRSEHEEVLATIRAWIAAGEDLTPYLSKRLQTAYIPHEQATGLDLPRRQDLDLLLSDWGIHHLHLGTGLDASNRNLVTRTRDLLFVAFEPDDAYLIGIFTHDDWALSDVVETSVRTWPEARLFIPSRSAIGLTRHYDDKDRRALREGGVTQLLEIDGNVYMPPGQTTAGTPMTVTRNVMKLRSSLDAWRTDTSSRLAAVDGVRPGAYWVPEIQAEECGFATDDAFVSVGRLAPLGRIG